MVERRDNPQHPGFVVLRELGDGRWQLVGEVRRRPGVTARAARTQAVLEATDGAARAGEVYAAVLRSEWSIAKDWESPKAHPEASSSGASVIPGRTLKGGLIELRRSFADRWKASRVLRGQPERPSSPDPESPSRARPG
jgi:hypothetical protein